MKRLLLIFILTFGFQSWTRADDIRDFEIEGIAIGDNLLDHFSLNHINSFDKDYYPKSKKFYEQYIFWPEKGNFDIYDGLTISLKQNSYKVYSISGALTNFKNFNECLNTKDQIVNDIISNYKSRVILEDLDKKLFDYADNKSKKSQTQIRMLDKSALFTVDCVDWSDKAEKKNNWTDNLGVQIYSKEYENFLRNEAYE
jgi:hypothetical protein